MGDWQIRRESDRHLELEEPDLVESGRGDGAGGGVYGFPAATQLSSIISKTLPGWSSCSRHHVRSRACPDFPGERTCHVLNPVVPACKTVCSSTSVMALVPPGSTCRLLSSCVGGSYMKLLWDGGGLTSDQHPDLHYPPTHGSDVVRQLRTHSEALELGTAISSARVSYRLSCTSCPISSRPEHIRLGRPHRPMPGQM